MPAPERRRDGAGARVAAEDGFSTVELLVATTILMLIVVAMTTILLDSLSNAVLTKTRLAAASIASDAIENAKAIGQGGLVSSPAQPPQCASPFTGSQSAATYGTCSYTETVDSTTYTVTPTVTVAAGQPDTVSVAVRWDAGSQVFVSTTQIGSLG